MGRGHGRWSRLVVLLIFALSIATSALALDRNAFTFTRYDLRVTVAPDKGTLSAGGSLEVRNDSSAPQKDIALQISSTLEWGSITAGGKPVSYVGQPYTSDIDHTGGLNEAIVSLQTAVAPGGRVKLNIQYAGTIPRDATRLTRIGTPEAVALRSDWDQIGAEFTAVRGLGYVTWYPVSIEAASLSSGTEVFDAIGRWKQRHAASVMDVRIAAVPGMRTVFKPGTDASFVIGNIVELPRENVVLLHVADHTQVARDYALATERALTTTTEWFGAPKQKVTIVELTNPDALPYDSGTFLFTPLKQTPSVALEVALARVAARASIDSPRPWIREGLATFAQALVRERQQGRRTALAYLNQFVNALAAAEAQPSRSGEASSKTVAQSLVTSNDELFYRTKAAFVWWMLRDMIGADALKSAISNYRSADDREPAYMQRLIEAASKRSLEEFFDSWVYRDRGLPDLRVDAANVRQTLPASEKSPAAYVAAITVENTGDVWTEVPVVVRGPSGERSARVAVAPKSKAVARIGLPEAPTSVVVNDGSVPEPEVSNNRFEFKSAAQ